MPRILTAGKKEWRKEGRQAGREEGRAGQGYLVIKAHFHGLVVPLRHNVQL